MSQSSRLPIVPTRFAILAWLLLGPVPARSQTQHVIHGSGPSENRFDIVFVSEGYTAAQMGDFKTKVEELVKGLMDFSPFKEYKHLLKITAVEVPSTESGLSDEGEGLEKDTVFKLRLKDDKQSDGTLKVRRQVIPKKKDDGSRDYDGLRKTIGEKLKDVTKDFVMVLVNEGRATCWAFYPSTGSWNYGVSGNELEFKNLAGYTGPEYGAVDVLAHELGHGILNLDDEYGGATTGQPTTEPDQFNCTLQSDKTRVKWKDFIEKKTPGIDVLEGCGGFDTGLYRPQDKCLMRITWEDLQLCDVCLEGGVRSIYKRVSPQEKVLPATGNLEVRAQGVFTVGGQTRLRVETIHDEKTELKVEWALGSRVVEGAKSSLGSGTAYELALGPEILTPGTHIVRFRALDRRSLAESWEGDIPPGVDGRTWHTSEWTITVKDPGLFPRLWDVIR